MIRQCLVVCIMLLNEQKSLPALNLTLRMVLVELLWTSSCPTFTSWGQDLILSNIQSHAWMNRSSVVVSPRSTTLAQSCITLVVELEFAHLTWQSMLLPWLIGYCNIKAAFGSVQVYYGLYALNHSRDYRCCFCSSHPTTVLYRECMKNIFFMHS